MNETPTPRDKGELILQALGNHLKKSHQYIEEAKKKTSR